MGVLKALWKKLNWAASLNEKRASEVFWRIFNGKYKRKDHYENTAQREYNIKEGLFLDLYNKMEGMIVDFLSFQQDLQG